MHVLVQTPDPNAARDFFQRFAPHINCEFFAAPKPVLKNYDLVCFYGMGDNVRALASGLDCVRQHIAFVVIPTPAGQPAPAPESATGQAFSRAVQQFLFDAAHRILVQHDTEAQRLADAYKLSPEKIRVLTPPQTLGTFLQDAVHTSPVSASAANVTTTLCELLSENEYTLENLRATLASDATRAQTVQTQIQKQARVRHLFSRGRAA